MTRSNPALDHTLPLMVAISVRLADSALGFVPCAWSIDDRDVSCLEMIEYVISIAAGDRPNAVLCACYGIAPSRLN